MIAAAIPVTTRTWVDPPGYDSERDTQYVDEAVLSSKDHISERVLCTMLFLSDHRALRAAINGSTHRASEASCARLLHL